MNFKTIILISSIMILYLTGSSQNLFITKNGHIWIFSTTSLEDIEAHNNNVVSYIDTNTGEIAIQLLVKLFKFDRSLMEEHFNENYMESSIFPKAEFKGRISNLSEINFKKNDTYNIIVEGYLSIHGIINKIKVVGKLEIVDSKISLSGKFSVVPQDYGIEIPDIVIEKIAETVDINVDLIYEPYKK